MDGKRERERKAPAFAAEQLSVFLEWSEIDWGK
jgi:hypothetical protein